MRYDSRSNSVTSFIGEGGTRTHMSSHSVAFEATAYTVSPLPRLRWSGPDSWRPRRAPPVRTRCSAGGVAPAIRLKVMRRQPPRSEREPQRPVAACRRPLCRLDVARTPRDGNASQLLIGLPRFERDPAGRHVDCGAAIERRSPAAGASAGCMRSVPRRERRERVQRHGALSRRRAAQHVEALVDDEPVVVRAERDDAFEAHRRRAEVGRVVSQVRSRRRARRRTCTRRTAG